MSIVKIYANRIWAGQYDYNSTNQAYLKLKDAVTDQMRLDVEDPKKVNATAEAFEEITGIPY